MDAGCTYVHVGAVVEVPRAAGKRIECINIDETPLVRHMVLPVRLERCSVPVLPRLPLVYQSKWNNELHFWLELWLEGPASGIMDSNAILTSLGGSAWREELLNTPFGCTQSAQALVGPCY